MPETAARPPAPPRRSAAGREAPFDPAITEDQVDRIVAFLIANGIREGDFPPYRPLRAIVAADARLMQYRRGDVIVRKGDYGHTMFGILDGAVRVITDGSGDEIAAPRQPRRNRSWLRALLRQWRAPRHPEVRRATAARVAMRQDDDGGARPVVADLQAVLARQTVALAAGAMFGEMAALSRTARSATVFADSDATLVELRWQGLRHIRRWSAAFRERVDTLYRERSLTNHLAQSPLFRHLDPEILAAVAASASFLSLGEFEWTRKFKDVSARDSAALIAHEPVVCEEGHYVNGLLLVASGFARVSVRRGYGHRTLGFLSSGEVHGLDEILAHVRHGEPLVHRTSLRALGYLDIIEVPTWAVERHVLPGLPPAGLPPRPALGEPLIEFLIDSRTINGRAAMVVDTGRCVGCDECVRACAANHDGNPRFVRNGLEHDRFLVAKACMHCVDPVCLIGCPTGGIGRDGENGTVLIDDDACIGCATCAGSCPYNNILLVRIRHADGTMAVEDGKPVLKAAKCDLCSGQPGGPACQRACPHGALVRIDMRDRAGLARWMAR